MGSIQNVVFSFTFDDPISRTNGEGELTGAQTTIESVLIPLHCTQNVKKKPLAILLSDLYKTGFSEDALLGEMHWSEPIL